MARRKEVRVAVVVARDEITRAEKSIEFCPKGDARREAEEALAYAEKVLANGRPGKAFRLAHQARDLSERASAKQVLSEVKKLAKTWGDEGIDTRIAEAEGLLGSDPGRAGFLFRQLRKELKEEAKRAKRLAGERPRARAKAKRAKVRKTEARQAERQTDASASAKAAQAALWASL